MNQQHQQEEKDKQLLEFISGLQLAFQNGELLLKTNQQNLLNNNKNTNSIQQQQQYSASTTFANVNNLSNQTFNYIINWLKQQSQANEVIIFFAFYFTKMCLNSKAQINLFL